MTPDQRVMEWRYHVERFRNARDRCTSTPDGQRLRAIYAVAAQQACREYVSARRARRAALEDDHVD